jgi:DNA-directed RNA polymerase subunit RPC12/RpoP
MNKQLYLVCPRCSEVSFPTKEPPKQKLPCFRCGYDLAQEQPRTLGAIVCGGCNQEFLISETWWGIAVKCPYCGLVARTLNDGNAVSTEERIRLEADTLGAYLYQIVIPTGLLSTQQRRRSVRGGFGCVLISLTTLGFLVFCLVRLAKWLF